MPKVRHGVLSGGKSVNQVRSSKADRTGLRDQDKENARLILRLIFCVWDY